MFLQHQTRKFLAHHLLSKRLTKYFGFHILNLPSWDSNVRYQDLWNLEHLWRAPPFFKLMHQWTSACFLTCSVLLQTRANNGQQTRGPALLELAGELKWPAWVTGFTSLLYVVLQPLDSELPRALWKPIHMHRRQAELSSNPSSIHLLAVWPWTISVTSQSLRSHVSKGTIRIVSISKDYVKIKWENTCPALSTVPDTVCVQREKRLFWRGCSGLLVVRVWGAMQCPRVTRLCPQTERTLACCPLKSELPLEPPCHAGPFVVSRVISTFSISCTCYKPYFLIYNISSSIPQGT